MLTPDQVWSVAPRPPRRWQREALPVALQAVHGGDTGIIYAATGSGKSHAQGAVLRALTPHPKWCDVVVVPTQDLVEQMRDDLSPWGLDVARYYGRKKEVAPVIAVCLPSVSALAEELAMRGTRVRLAMIDECHRVGAASTTEALAELQPARRIGWSATPIRTQGVKVLRDLWPAGIIYGYSIFDAIKDGAIVGFDYVQQKEADASDDANVATLKMMQEHAVYPAVVDALDVADAEWFAGWLCENGIRAAHIDGSMGKLQRAELLRRLETGDLQTLVHVRLLTEGVNLPWLRTIVVRAQTGSIIRWVQYIGRGLRTWPGKDRCVVIDVQYQSDRHRKMAFDDKWLEDIEAEMEKEATAAAGGGGGGERMLDEAGYVRDLESWAAKLCEWMVANGYITDPRPRGKGWRSEQPTQKQLPVLEQWRDDGRKSPARYLPEEHRERFKQLVGMPEMLSRGGVADLMDIGFALKAKARAHKDRTGQWWRGLQSADMCRTGD